MVSFVRAPNGPDGGDGRKSGSTDPDAGGNDRGNVGERPVNAGASGAQGLDARDERAYDETTLWYDRRHGGSPMTRVVCPGSFDPVTNGHLDIITRASFLFDEVVVVVLVNESKMGLFDTEERIDLIRRSVRQRPNVTVDSYAGLLVDYCAQPGFDGLDATGYYFPGYPKVPAAAFLHGLKRRAFLNGVTISGTGVRNDFAVADAEARRRDVAMVKAWIAL